MEGNARRACGSGWLVVHQLRLLRHTTGEDLPPCVHLSWIIGLILAGGMGAARPMLFLGLVPDRCKETLHILFLTWLAAQVHSI